MIRVAIALLAIGLMSLSAFAQTPEQNEEARAATAQRLIMGEKNCSGCDLFQTDLSYQELPGVDLTGSRLRQADLSLSTLDKARLTGANLSVANAFGARFEDADATGVNFEDAVLVGAWFGGANLTGADLKGANVSGAYLVTATGLTQGQLDAACGDASTELPKGMTVAACKSS